MTKIIDISPVVGGDIQVWPGDTPYKHEWLTRMEDGASCNLSSVTSTPHVGAHADGPLHFSVDGQSIGEVELEPYVGPCRVIDLTGVRTIDRDAMFGIETYGVERLLFKTGTFPDHLSWDHDFAHFDPALLKDLGKMGIKLVGIDTPSVDAFDSTTLPSHHMLLEMEMRNLEGLDLSEVEEGDYELIALPLRLMGVDSSPVRAILRTQGK